MSEAVMDAGPGITLSDITGGLARRWRLIAGVTLLGTLLALLVAWVLPPVYTSTAKILVETQQIPDELARSTVTASATERLQRIEQRLMARENLLEVVHRLGLFADRPGMSPTAMVEAIRASTKIEGIEPERRREGISVFTISFTSSDNREAARVANEFVTRVLELNLDARTTRATETNEFFKAEMERLNEEIARAEAEITDFKQKHAAALPDSLAFRQNELLTLRQRIYDREQQRILLEEQRRQLGEALEFGTGDTVAGGGLTPEEREIQRLSHLLLQRRTVLSERHPQIRALEAQIAALTARAQPVLSDAAPAGAVQYTPAQQAARRQTVQQIELLETQIEMMAEYDLADQARRRELEAALEAAPRVSVDLNVLERRYAELQRKYDIAVAKQAQAETGEKLEVNRQAERFEVIEQARVQERPDAPNRQLLAAGGAAGSLALGLALAAVIEFSNGTIRTPLDLERSLRLRPVVTVPVIHTSAEIRERRRRRRLLLVVVLVVVPGILFTIDQWIIPLESLLDQIVARTGIGQLVWMIEKRFGL